MNDGDHWTLQSFIEHSQEVRELERQRHHAEQALVTERLDHQREVAKIREETNAIHFHQLNENAKQTIEERGHFISKEMFEPFRDQVLEFMHGHSARRQGASTVIPWALSGIGILFGLVGVFLAIWTRL